MFIRKKKDSNRNTTRVQIVESVRIGKKVSQRIIRHLGSVNSSDEVQLEKLLVFAKQTMNDLEQSRNPNLPIFSAKELSTLDEQIQVSKAKLNEPIPYNDRVQDCKEEVRYISGVRDVFGKMLSEFGWDKLLGSRSPKSNRLVSELIKARISCPESKRATVKTLEQQAGVQLNLDRVYKTMDKIDESCITKIKEVSAMRAQQLLSEPLSVLFYDTTTLYFESECEDDLRVKGFSKDGKTNRVQVLLAMVVTEHGIPLGYHVYKGNQYEGSTLLDAVDQLYKQFSGCTITVVADAGLLSKSNCDALKQAKIPYVLGYRTKSAPAAIKSQILCKEAYTSVNLDAKDSLSLQEIEVADERIIATHSSKSQRKAERLRAKQIEKIRKQLKRNTKVTAFSKHSALLDFTKAGEVSLSEEKVNKAKRWDGIRAIVSFGCNHMKAEAILSAYRQLWQIEHAFRVNKHDLKIRPIYHWSSKRIHAHIALCYMAYCCMQHLRYRLALKSTPMSVDAIRQALISVQYSVLRHNSKRRYVSPSPISTEAKRIYQAVGIKWYEYIFYLYEK